MRTQSRDTHPEIERLLIEGYRRMSAAEKMRCVQQLNFTVWELAASSVRKMHPGADEREVALRVASRTIPADLMRKAFSWDPEIMGF
ncbi:MAG TPA: hypothetical protein VGM51_15395 [Armatimonadota bacterium]|jgi:hypothetical protein